MSQILKRKTWLGLRTSCCAIQTPYQWYIEDFYDTLELHSQNSKLAESEENSTNLDGKVTCVLVD